MLLPQFDDLADMSDLDSNPILHLYRTYPSPVGAVALCGHVKNLPTIVGHSYDGPHCVVCADLGGRR